MNLANLDFRDLHIHSRKTETNNNILVRHGSIYRKLSCEELSVSKARMKNEKKLKLNKGFDVF